LAEDAAHPLEDELALAAAAVLAVKRKARRAGDLGRAAAFPVIGLVPGQENPGSRLDRIGVADRRAEQGFDRSDLDTGHSASDPCSAASSRVSTVFHAPVAMPRWAAGSRTTLIGSSPCSTRLTCSRKRRRSMTMPLSDIARFSSAWTAIGRW